MMTVTVIEDRPSAAGRPERTTGSLARFVVETPFEDLPGEVVTATRQQILDEIIVTAAAHGTPMAEALLQLKAGPGGAPESTLIVDGRRVPAASAAYVHGQLANLLDADETMHNRMHAVSASVVTGLAMAEKLGSSGRELITAVATGYDITARVGTSLKQYVPDGNGGLVFATRFGFSWMTLGGAATTGRLLGLDVDQVAMALGQALVTTPAYFDISAANDRLMTDERRAAWHKYQMSGAMAEAGLNAAQLVAYGWIAQEDQLDEGMEFWRSFAAPGCDWDNLYDRVGERWFIAETSIKPYPFCRYGHGALDVMTKLVADHGFSVDDIDEIVVRIPPHELGQKLLQTTHADESLKLMMSEPTALALVALGVPPGPQWFNADFGDERLRATAAKVRLKVEDSWGPVLVEQMARDGYFQRLPTEVVVRTTAGLEHRGYADVAAGDPWGDGAYTDDDLAAKAYRFLDGILPRTNIDALIDAVTGLADATDISAVVKAMAR